jgi:hypothetical protein
VARLARTPPENGDPDDGILSACESAVPEVPRDVGRSGVPGAGETDEQAIRSGDVSSRFCTAENRGNVVAHDASE